MEILGIIPARGGSKGIKRKNLKEILGKPLVAYSIEAGINSKLITKVVVSTEDSEIKEISLKYGAEVIDRPIELAKDETKTAPVMMHVLDELEKDGYKPDYVVLLQPTSPQRNGEFLDKALEFFFENKEYDSCFSGYLFNISHSKWIKSKNGKMNAIYDYHKRPRRQESEFHYDIISEDGAFYVLSYENFRKYEDFLGNNPIAYLGGRFIDLDTEEDLKLIEADLSKND